jgi:hypothetical protein
MLLLERDDTYTVSTEEYIPPEGKVVTLKYVLDNEFKNTKFNKELAKRLYRYQVTWLNQSREYLEFFGSPLLGVNVIRFKDTDMSKFFYEVLELDMYEIRDSIRHATTIDHSYKVGGDILNIVVMYIVHRFLNSKDVDDHTRYKACYDVIMIFFYRCMAALNSYYFKYPSDIKIAEAAYANLTNKFLIKKLGSWYKVMDYRTNSVLDKKGIHYNNLVKFTVDDAIVYAITDSQNRVRDLYKNYYAVFIDTHQNKEGISVTSNTVIDMNGQDTLVDRTKGIDNYITYLQTNITDKNSFINKDLVRIISGMFSNGSVKPFTKLLEWLSDNYRTEHHAKISRLVDAVVAYSFYLMDTRIKSNKDLSRILLELKNLYLSSRNTDIELYEIRELSDYIVKKSKIGGRTIGNTLKLAMILYITLKALTKNRG